MARLDGLATVLDFLNGLQLKILTVGWVERSETQHNAQMLGFVPQPNLRKSIE
ncbi:hypothetical protein [Brasilonema octagenarum]|uniref:hypothetical protein n=1 Tax=Brasilonema octagenarum TaxID=417105 RepID=UPI002006E0FE|nr:hypothetical protein [Brasilonema octagenarum]